MGNGLRVAAVGVLTGGLVMVGATAPTLADDTVAPADTSASTPATQATPAPVAVASDGRQTAGDDGAPVATDRQGRRAALLVHQRLTVVHRVLGSEATLKDVPKVCADVDAPKPLERCLEHDLAATGSAGDTGDAAATTTLRVASKVAAVTTASVGTSEVSAADEPGVPALGDDDPVVDPTPGPGDSLADGTVSDGDTDLGDDTTTAADEPTDLPTELPTGLPTELPTDPPTDVPTELPTDLPTELPTDEPTDEPTGQPTDAPTDLPTGQPTGGTGGSGGGTGGGTTGTSDGGAESGGGGSLGTAGAAGSVPQVAGEEDTSPSASCDSTVCSLTVADDSGAQPAQDGSTLPATGASGDSAPIGLLGFGLVAVGATMVLRRPAARPVVAGRHVRR